MTGFLATALITKLTVSNDLDSEDIRAIHSLPIRGRKYPSGEGRLAE
jgi:hypothetical protein